MKTSRFSDAQIIAILKQAESGSPSLSSAVSMASAPPPSTSGAPNSVAWMPLSWRASKSWKRKIVALRRCMPRAPKAEIISEAMAKVVTPSARRRWRQGCGSLRHFYPSGLPGVQR